MYKKYYLFVVLPVAIIVIIVCVAKIIIADKEIKAGPPEMNDLLKYETDLKARQ